MEGRVVVDKFRASEQMLVGEIIGHVAVEGFAARFVVIAIWMELARPYSTL
jgi:hypothetical protein